MKKNIATPIYLEIKPLIHNYIPFSEENIKDPLNQIHKFLDRFKETPNSEYLMNLKDFKKILKPLNLLIENKGEEIFYLMLTNLRHQQSPLTRCPHLKDYLKTELNISL